MIVGIGVDIVDLARFENALARPGFKERLFTDTELSGEPTCQTLAGRFAAKEALAKALSTDGSLAWHDVEVLNAESGAPHFSCFSSVVARMKAAGAELLHLSISHDAGAAVAFVVAEGAKR